MNQSSVFQPPDRQRVDERIATTIADAILDGVFPPGSTLPPERDLAERLGVNRTSLRQGLARLQQMGLIEVRHGSGSVVRDPEGLSPIPRWSRRWCANWAPTSSSSCWRSARR